MPATVVARIAADTTADQDNLPVIAIEVSVAKIPPAGVKAPRPQTEKQRRRYLTGCLVTSIMK